MPSTMAQKKGDPPIKTSGNVKGRTNDAARGTAMGGKGKNPPWADQKQQMETKGGSPPK